MAKTPPDATKDVPPGDLPAPSGQHTLAPPSAQALRRAAPLFAQLMGLGAPGRPMGPAPQGTEPSSAPSGQAPHACAPERAYPQAARLLGLAQAAPPPGPPVSEPEPPPQRPQGRLPGFVRKSVPKAALVPQVLLEDVAQMALFDEGQEPQGGSFVIVFREELLGELQCRIEITPTGEVAAAFLAADAQTLTLLRAHTARLEAQLSSHGLRHVTLTIEPG